MIKTVNISSEYDLAVTVLLREINAGRVLLHKKSVEVDTVNVLL